MEGQEKSSKTKKAIILSLCVVTLVFACIMGTYAYFIINVNNDDRQNAQIDTGTMKLTFADGNPTINERIMLGENKTKTFTLENTGDLDAVVSIDWLDIVNTYMEGSLTYTLEQSETEGSGYTEIIGKTNVPVTSTAFTTTLAPDIEIPVGKKYYYNLIITFNDLQDVDQEADRKANLSTKFTVSQPSTNRNYDLIIDPNGGTLGDTNTVQTLTKKNGETETIGTPTKEGETFLGWKISGYGSSLADGTLTIGKSNTKVVAEWEKPIVGVIKKLGVTPIPVTDTMPDFSAITTASDAGLYSMEDDYGTSYFYRGAVTNNYVKFGKWANDSSNGSKAGKNMFWRIIRVNGDGSVRIIYDGTIAYANGEASLDRCSHVFQVYNSNYDDAKYVGWMYGGTLGEPSTSKAQAQTNETNSTLKSLVDVWYKTNIVDAGYSGSVADSIFCNDRSTPGQEATGLYSDTGLGYGTNLTGYGVLARFKNGNSNNYTPIFKCPQKNDAFTVNDEEKGNGALTYPVGLITADEIVASGGKYGTTNSTYYLYNPAAHSWSLSPRAFIQTNSLMTLLRSGRLENSLDLFGSGDVSPVINLTAEYFKTLKGTGSMSDPFRAE